MNKNKLNVLLVNNQAEPEISGVASHFESISKNIMLLGHTVERLVAENKSTQQKNKGLSYHYFRYIEGCPKDQPSERQTRIKNNRVFLEYSLKKIKWQLIDLVIVGNDYYLPLLKKYISPKKIVVIIPSSLGFSKKANPEKYKKIISRMKKTLLNVKVVVLSRKMESMLKYFLGIKYNIFVIPPGVDLERFSKKNKPFKNDVLYVGRMAEEKNVKDLILALNLVKINVRIKLVGTGNRLAEIKKLARAILKDKKIFFAGKQKQVEKYYTESRIFVLPSRYEAFGLVILEAMAAGLPVIAFSPTRDFLTASDEIISNGVDGFLVKNIIEMSEKIELLLNNKKLRATMSKNALKKAALFSWARHTKKLLQLITKD